MVITEVVYLNGNIKQCVSCGLSLNIPTGLKIKQQSCM